MNSSSSKNISPDMVTIYRMTFIYNAILSGWTVKKLNDNKFEFSNTKDELKKEFHLDDFLQKFVESNLNINHIVQANS